MSTADEFEHVTTNSKVEIYEAGRSIFEGLLMELRQLSKKKPGKSDDGLAQVSRVDR